MNNNERDDSDVTQETEPTSDGKSPVPYERFQSVASERKQLKKELEQLRAERDEWKTRLYELQADFKEAGSWKGKYDELTNSFESFKKQATEERELFSLGLSDQEAIDVARLYHNRLPSENRPPLVDWLKELQKKPDEMPKALKAVYNVPSPPSVPNANKSAGANPPNPAPVSIDYRNMTRDQYKKVRETVLQQYRSKQK